jgi:hypothetical protein
MAALNEEDTIIVHREVEVRVGNNPLSPPCIPPKFVLHGLSSKSKFLAVSSTKEIDFKSG